jgi:hypothetical protein
MSERESADITQKDLLKLLFDQAQHNATREEVQAVDNKINELYQNVATKEDVHILNAKIESTAKDLKIEIEKSEGRMQAQFNKLDVKIWGIAIMIVGLAFKTEIMAWLA